MALVTDVDGVHKISTRTDKIVGNTKGPGEPWAVGVTPDGKRMYVADSLKFVYGFNVSTLKQTAKIWVGSIPQAVAVSPDGAHLYVGDYNAAKQA